MSTAGHCDPSNGYERVADDFMSIRSRSNIGAETVRDWTKSLRSGAAVLDIGCGHGIPISRLLVDEGFNVYGIDASSRMIAAFREHVPQAQAACESIEHSNLFGREFDGIVACGIVFLLSPDLQATLIRKVSRALQSGGRFAFTAPHQECEWLDNLTGRKCISLGFAAYGRMLEAEGLALLGNREDEGQNYYYFAGTSDEQKLQRARTTQANRLEYRAHSLKDCTSSLPALNTVDLR